VLATLPAARGAVDHLRRALRADAWQDREAGLCAAAGVILDVQRRAGLPAPADGGPVQRFYERPYQRVRPEVVERLLGAVRDPAVRALPPELGSVEQWTDDVALLTGPVARRRPADGD
jgi:hypothetical protein